MKVFLLIFLVLLSLFLILLILLQQRGSGVGTAFGGAGEVYRSQRGVEKIFHYLTIILAFLYAGLSLILIFVN